MVEKIIFLDVDGVLNYMSYRNANYSAFYVSEPFSESNLGANSTHDFVYYNMLRLWRG